MLKQIVSVEVKGRAVVINITPVEENMLRLINNYIETTLDFACRFDVVKRYSNRIDQFFIVPQRGWEPVEVVVELKKLLRL